jgi:putative heme iron utilization protein
MATPVDPIRPTTAEARALARGLIDTARFGALAVLDPQTGAPYVARVAVTSDDAGPVTLISALSLHTGALRADRRAALLLGEPGLRGDPLTHPRVTLQTCANFVPRNTPDHDALRTLWLVRHPKAKLYIDFTDFSFVRLKVLSAALNGGFGQAFRLTPGDLALPDPG